MSFFKRLLGISATPKPTDEGAWRLEGNKLLLDLDRLAELKNPGGAVRLEAKELPKRVLLLRGAQGGLHAYVNQCPHAGRRLDPLGGGSRVQCCSVGKSTFELDGKLVTGLAKKDLPRLMVKEDGASAEVLLD